MIDHDDRISTKETNIWEARAKISAQETTPGQTFSNAALISSTTSNPAAEWLLGRASFSLSMPSALSSKIDPSQPYTHSYRRPLQLARFILYMHAACMYNTLTQVLKLRSKSHISIYIVLLIWHFLRFLFFFFWH